MTASISARPARRWSVRGAGTVRAITWATRLVGLLALASAIAPVGRRRLRPSLSEWLGLPPEATVAAGVVVLGAAVLLFMLAAGLRRRKRRAWQLALVLTALIIALHLAFRHAIGVVAATGVLFAALVINRREFRALPDPTVGRWRAPLVFIQLAGSGVVINYLILMVGKTKLVGEPPALDRLQHSVLALIGISGPVEFRTGLLDDLTAGVGLLFGVGAVLLGGYFLLRSAEPKPALSAEDEVRIRALLDTHGEQDSLGYFALRPDKSVVFSASGKAAVTYRVVAGVALASGDPLGDLEAWPGAIEEFLDTCRRYSWIPAVLGCSERGATVWARHDLHALEMGDEAVVDTATFTLDGRPIARGQADGLPGPPGGLPGAGASRRNDHTVRMERTGHPGRVVAGHGNRARILDGAVPADRRAGSRLRDRHRRAERRGARHAPAGSLGPHGIVARPDAPGPRRAGHRAERADDRGHAACR